MEGIKVIIAFVVAHAAANILKIIIRSIEYKKVFSLKKAIRIILDSGGMPSAHTASFSGATMMVGLIRGFTSVEFAIMLSMLFIIMYDAINVRYAVGEQGKTLNAILRQKNERELKIVEGHTLAQVAVGLLVGVATASLLGLF